MTEQRVSVTIAALPTAGATGPLVAACIGMSRAGLDPADVLHAVAALSVVALGPALLRPARLVRAAVHDDDTVDAPALDAAGALLRRTGPVAARRPSPRSSPDPTSPCWPRPFRSRCSPDRTSPARLRHQHHARRRRRPAAR